MVGQNFMVLHNSFASVKSLLTLWRFSRPHTIIGSTLSIVAIFFIAARNVLIEGPELQLLLLSLLSALACNIYITGLNQWSDIEVDKINKPWLPIASGELSKKNAFRIVAICGFLSIIITFRFSVFFTGLILLILAIGTAYSLPPLKFKRNHIAAASAIALVRGLLVNVGFYLIFISSFMDNGNCKTRSGRWLCLLRPLAWGLRGLRISRIQKAIRLMILEH